LRGCVHGLDIPPQFRSLLPVVLFAQARSIFAHAKHNGRFAFDPCSERDEMQFVVRL
jgi:hypothetical protein